MKIPAHRALDEHLAFARYVESDVFLKETSDWIGAKQPVWDDIDDFTRLVRNRVDWAKAIGRFGRTIYVDEPMMHMVNDLNEAKAGKTIRFLFQDLFCPIGFACFWGAFQHKAVGSPIKAVCWAHESTTEKLVVGVYHPQAQPRLVLGTATSNPTSSVTSHATDLVTSLNTVMSQTIVSTSVIEPTRDQGRRLERSGVEPDFGRIVLVHLRRRRETNEANPDPTPADYSHRFVVRGHWRNQWHPSVESHRLVWIDDYIKGPEDRPLIVKDPLYWLHR